MLISERLRIIAEIEKRGGFIDQRFNERHKEWSTIIVMPIVRQLIWGFGDTLERSLLDAYNQFAGKIITEA